MEGDKDQGKRISAEQRELMLNFMSAHPSLATGKFSGPDGAKNKQRLLNELTAQLNSHPTGVSKTADKWNKSWQDWRSDVKSKSALLKREINKTGGGKLNPKAKPLSPLEERLLAMLGPNIIYGHADVLDPMTPVVIAENEAEASTSTAVVENIEVEIPSEPQIFFLPHDGTLTNITASTCDPLRTSSEGDTPLENPNKKRKVSRNSNMGTEETGDFGKLLNLTERQVQQSEETLNLQRRQTEAVESASAAICGAMRAMEAYYNKKANNI